MWLAVAEQSSSIYQRNWFTCMPVISHHWDTRPDRQIECIWSGWLCKGRVVADTSSSSTPSSSSSVLHDDYHRRLWRGNWHWMMNTLIRSVVCHLWLSGMILCREIHRNKSIIEYLESMSPTRLNDNHAVQWIIKQGVMLLPSPFHQGQSNRYK